MNRVPSPNASLVNAAAAVVPRVADPIVVRRSAFTLVAISLGVWVLTAALDTPSAMDIEVARSVREHALRVGAVATTLDRPASADAPTRALAERYLTALPQGLREQITRQVRDEQRTGVTPAGRAAFVLRRLELYELHLSSPHASPP